MDIKESYVMAISRAHLTTYEARLLLMAINSGQALLKHRALSKEKAVLEHHYNMVELAVPIRDITTDKGEQNVKLCYNLLVGCDTLKKKS